MNDQARTREEKNRINSVSDRRQRFIRTKILPLLDDINNEQDVVKSKFYSMCIDCYSITEKTTSSDLFVFLFKCFDLLYRIHEVIILKGCCSRLRYDQNLLV